MRRFDQLTVRLSLTVLSGVEWTALSDSRMGRRAARIEHGQEPIYKILRGILQLAQNLSG